MNFSHRAVRCLAGCAFATLLLSTAGVAFSKPAAAKPADAATQAAQAHAAAATSGLARLHKDKAGADCADCHGARIAPDDNESVENAACVECHGNYAKLGPKTAARLKNKDINPHASHLGPEVACTACHAGHQESTAYCVNCHTNFVMPMSGNAKRQ